MVFKKSFQLLVATGTTPFFTAVSIIFAHDCTINKQKRETTETLRDYLHSFKGTR